MLILPSVTYRRVSSLPPYPDGPLRERDIIRLRLEASARVRRKRLLLRFGLGQLRRFFRSARARMRQRRSG